MVHVHESEINRIANIEDVEERKSQIEHLLYVEGVLIAENAGKNYPDDFLETLSSDLFDAGMEALKVLDVPECIMVAIDIAFCLDKNIDFNKLNQAAAIFDWVHEGLNALYATRAMSNPPMHT